MTCPECGGTGEVEEDATGALGYVVKRPCLACTLVEGEEEARRFNASNRRLCTCCCDRCDAPPFEHGCGRPGCNGPKQWGRRESAPSRTSEDFHEGWLTGLGLAANVARCEGALGEAIAKRIDGIVDNAPGDRPKHPVTGEDYEAIFRTVRAEKDALRAKNHELHQRAQKAEAALSAIAKLPTRDRAPLAKCIAEKALAGDE